jgi:hypothetical protein
VSSPTGASVYTWEDRFFGQRSYSATATSNAGHNWAVTTTETAGTMVYAPVDGGPGVSITFDSDSEIENGCLSFGNNLAFDIDSIIEATFRVKQGQATIDSATSLAFGLIGDRNDAIDSIAQNMVFRLIGSNAVVVETDDGTTDTDDVATGKTLSTTATDFTISLATGKSDVRFFIGGQPVATGTTFSMAAYSGALQPFIQLQKTADVNVDSVTLEWVRVLLRI